MGKVLQGILIAGSEMRDAVKSGEKLITIREGHRDYSLGPVLIGCHLLDWAVLGEITQVIHTRLKDVSYENLVSDGFSSHAQAVATLQQWYSDINMDSKVTVIKWKLK